MNQSKLIFILVFLTCLSSCEPRVTFTLPQPADVNNLSKFPKRLQGKYLNPIDNSMLSIDDKIIQRIFDYDYKFHMNELDSTQQLSGDTIIDLKTNEKIKIKRDADTLITHIHRIDTVFKIDYDNVVRKFKGYYFLNKRYDKESWEVKKIQLTKGQLLLSTISTENNIKNLIQITESPEDTVSPYKFAPTKKQFKEFVKTEGFSDIEIFVKRKNGL